MEIAQDFWKLNRLFIFHFVNDFFLLLFIRFVLFSNYAPRTSKFLHSAITNGELLSQVDKENGFLFCISIQAQTTKCKYRHLKRVLHANENDGSRQTVQHWKFSKIFVSRCFCSKLSKFTNNSNFKRIDGRKHIMEWWLTIFI